MKPQFTVATLSLCVTVLAVLLSLCIKLPVRDFYRIPALLYVETEHGWEPAVFYRPPTAAEVALRLVGAADLRGDRPGAMDLASAPLTQ